MTGPRRKSIRLPAEVYAQDGRHFSLTLCSNKRRVVFDNDAFVASCIDCLSDVARRSGSEVLVFCFMPDHLHLLVRIGRLPLPRLVQQFKSLTANRWCGMHRRGSFWQRGYYDHALRAEEGFRRVAAYILENPVRAGLVSNWAGYPYSGSLAWNLRDL